MKKTIKLYLCSCCFVNFDDCLELKKMLAQHDSPRYKSDLLEINECFKNKFYSKFELKPEQLN